MSDQPKSSIREAWILFMVLGLCMINFPFIHIFVNGQHLFGIPKLVLYFMLGWPASIVVIWLFVRALDRTANGTLQSPDKSNT